MKSLSKKWVLAFWIGLPITAIAGLIAYLFAYEAIFIAYVLFALSFGCASTLIWNYRSSYKSRTGMHFLYTTLVTIIVVAIVCVANFISFQHPFKWDLTRDKFHSLSEQSIKIIKDLQNEATFTLFSNLPNRDKYSTLFDNYRTHNPKIKFEYIDPHREIEVAKAKGLQRYNQMSATLLIEMNSKRKFLEDINEEKITNTLIELSKDKKPTFCALLGHGEGDFFGTDAQSYQQARAGLEEQSVVVEKIELQKEAKIPEKCGAIGILGPNKTFFAPEIKAIEDYLASGGRAMIGLNLNPNGSEASPDLLKMLSQWGIDSPMQLVIERNPLSQVMGGPTVSLISEFSRDSKITSGAKDPIVFPMTRPLNIRPAQPAGLSVQWLARTNKSSLAVRDLSGLKKGVVKAEVPGPFNVAVTVDGKAPGKTTTKNTRLVVVGNALFASNQFFRAAGNSDFFMNSVSWLLDEESLISIRSKKEEGAKLEVSAAEASFFLIFCIFLLPLGIASIALVVWLKRRNY